jgi:hypothetical protein
MKPGLLVLPGATGTTRARPAGRCTHRITTRRCCKTGLLLCFTDVPQRANPERHSKRLLPPGPGYGNSKVEHLIPTLARLVLVIEPVDLETQSQ